MNALKAEIVGKLAASLQEERYEKIFALILKHVRDKS